MRLVKQLDGRAQYDYTVEDADGRQITYRTSKLIAHSTSDDVGGKGTRIWKAVRLEDGQPCGAPLVLKDVWIHEELSREGQNLADIRLSDSSEPAQKLFDRTLLTVLHDGDVVIRPQSALDPPYRDCTRLHANNARALLYGHSYVDSRFEPPDRSRDFGIDCVTKNRAVRGRRVHYRIVFKEICTPIPPNASFSFLGKVLRDICESEYLV